MQTDNEIIVSDYSQMDRVLKEERTYILGMCKAIKAAGCNVLLIQKSILRDAVNDLALHFLAKMKIVVVRDVERDAGDTLSAFDQVNPSAPEGNQHVLVEIVVRFTDSDGFGNPSAIPFFVSDGDRRWEDIEAQCGIVPDAILDTAFLSQDEEVVGNTCFTVPSDAVVDLVFGTEGVNGSLYFALPE